MGDLQAILVTSPMPAVRALISQRFREILIIIIIDNFCIALFSGVPKLTRAVLVTSLMPAVRALISQRFREILIIIDNFCIALFSGVTLMTAAGALISKRFRRREILREPL